MKVGGCAGSRRWTTLVFLPAALVSAIIASACFASADPSTERIASFTLPPNPVIQAMVDSVSPSNLYSTSQTLQGFYTRSTVSDTVSTTTGIGAARRWVRSQLDAVAQAPGSRLQASYFTFDTTVCSIAGRHRNVLGTIIGQMSPSRYFIVTGHLDSRTIVLCDATSFAPGANDDGSGVAVILEMSRILSRYDLDASMIMMAVTGEEQGLVGSTAYAKWAQQHAMRIDGMITNDIVGDIVGCVDPTCPDSSLMITDSLSVRHYSQGPATSIHRQLTRAMKLNAARYLPGFTVTLIPAHDRSGRAGDHFPFDARGYAAARFIQAHEFGDGSGNNGHQHNGTDVIDYVNAPYMARVAKLNLACFANLALAPESPAAPIVQTLTNGLLRVTWPSVTTAPDLAGYRVALRGTAADSLFYFDVRDAGYDQGPSQTYYIGDLPPNVAVNISVSAYDADGNESIFSPEVLGTPGVVDVDTREPTTTVNSLRGIEPNPASDAFAIEFDLAARSLVGFDAIDASGRVATSIQPRIFDSGTHRLRWNPGSGGGKTLAAGTYFVRMTVDGRSAGRLKLVLLR